MVKFTQSNNYSMSWFRNATALFSSPTQTFQTTLPLAHSLFCLFCPFSPTRRMTRENCWHKRQRSEIEIRTIYWKHQWDKKINSGNNNINNKEYPKKRTFYMQKFSPQSPTQWAKINKFLTIPCFCSTTKGQASFPERGNRVPFPCLWQWHKTLLSNRIPSHTPSCWYGPEPGHCCSGYRFWISSLQQCHTQKKK